VTLGAAATSQQISSRWQWKCYRAPGKSKEALNCTCLEGTEQEGEGEESVENRVAFVDGRSRGSRPDSVFSMMPRPDCASVRKRRCNFGDSASASATVCGSDASFESTLCWRVQEMVPQSFGPTIRHCRCRKIDSSLQIAAPH
jgi:hypothetical protein